MAASNVSSCSGNSDCSMSVNCPNSPRQNEDSMMISTPAEEDSPEYESEDNLPTVTAYETFETIDRFQGPVAIRALTSIPSFRAEQRAPTEPNLPALNHETAVESIVREFESVVLNPPRIRMPPGGQVIPPRGGGLMFDTQAIGAICEFLGIDPNQYGGVASVECYNFVVSAFRRLQCESSYENRRRDAFGGSQ